LGSRPAWELGWCRRALASDATHCAAGNASKAWITAWRRENKDSTTVGDKPPTDAFPASSSGLVAAVEIPRRPAASNPNAEAYVVIP